MKQESYPKTIKGQTEKTLENIVNNIDIIESDETQYISINKRIDNVMKKIGVPEYWIDKRFKDLEGDNNFLESVGKIKQWDFKKPVSVSILSRYSGNGKTHISVCLLRKYIYGVLNNNPNYDYFPKEMYTKEGDLYYRILASYKENSYESEKDIVDIYCKLPFLVIDDIFKNRDNEFAYRTMQYIVDKRIDWERLPTVITSNVLLNDFKDSSMKSRLQSPLCLELIKTKTDYRKINK
ncbi:MAG: hypothetical protein WC358_00070 [Ignavibacteria bacterium]|jgi:hypothetical protein